MQIAFDAPSLTEAKDIAEPLAKEFLDYLTFASSLRTRLRDLRHISIGSRGTTETANATTTRLAIRMTARRMRHLINSC
jgi:hypothetical protein